MEKDIRVTVKEVKNITPSCFKGREEWEKWKFRPCDAGYGPGQELIFKKGKILVDGKIPCFASIYHIIEYIMGISCGARFPWLERPKSGYVIEKDGIFVKNKTMGFCPDAENTVIFEIEQIDEGK